MVGRRDEIREPQSELVGSGKNPYRKQANCLPRAEDFLHLLLCTTPDHCSDKIMRTALSCPATFAMVKLLAVLLALTARMPHEYLHTVLWRF